MADPSYLHQPATKTLWICGRLMYLVGAELSPDDEVFVAVAASVFVTDDGQVVVAVAEVAEG